MNFIAQLFKKKPKPLSGEIDELALAKFLAYDGKDLDEQWFSDTCLSAGICMPNAKFAWEAMKIAEKRGSEFGAGIMFALRLVRAQATTKDRLAKLMTS